MVTKEILVSVPMREGFWYSNYEPYLPKPVGDEKPWKGKKEFLTALTIKESTAAVTRYRGWSICRLCSWGNGSNEYRYKGWVWPEGLYHYIQDHNVRPSLAFQEFILGRQLGETK